MGNIGFRFRSALFGAAVLFTSVASAGWNLSINKSAFTLSDDSGNWVLTGAIVNGTDLTINKVTQGSGDLDLTDFAGPNGETLVGFGPGQNNVGSPFVANSLTSVKVPATVTTLATRAFEWCADLATVDLPGVVTVGTLAFNGCSALPSVSLPAATSIGYQSFSGCTALEEVSLPSIVRIEGKRYNGTFYKLTGLKRLTLGESLEYIGQDAFNGCTGIESIEPSAFPKLTQLDAAAFEGAFVATGIAFPSTPALETLGDNALYNCKIAGELEFPSLLSIAQNNFSSCPLLTKVKAPKLTTIAKNCCQSSNGLLALEFSQSLTSIGDNFLKNVTSLLYFEPLFPTNLTTTLSAAKVYNSCALTNSEVIYNFPAIPEVPAQLCQKPTNITKVVFDSNVTSIGKSAFEKLGPNAEVIFHGLNAPTLADYALYRADAEKNNDRIVIRFDNPNAVDQWNAVVAPNDERFQTYLDKPDYPGEKTIGLLSLSKSTYAWVVNEAEASENSYLVVRGNPAEIGEVSPAYGYSVDIAVGSSFDCTAPESFNDGAFRATLAGYVVSNLNEVGGYTFADSGEGTVCHYTQAKSAGDLTWIWTDCQYRVTAAVEGEGAVDVADQWADVGGTVTITATPAAGHVFRYWEGGADEAQKHAPALTLTVDRAFALTAVFGVETDDTFTWVYDAEAKTLTAVSADGSVSTWKFAVTGDADALTLVTHQAGFGELNLPECVTEIGTNLFKSNDELTAVSGPGVRKIGKNAFNDCSVLTTIDFPNLEVVMPGAFRYDKALVGDMVFSNLVSVVNDTSGNNFETAQFTSFCAPALTNIGTAAFRQCSVMTNFVMSESCKRIGNTAFYGCASLTNIVPFLPKDMDEIGEIPFTQGKKLSCPLVWDQANIQEIGENLFAYHQYSEITILSPVTNLAVGAFGSIKAGTHINFYCDAPTMADKAIYQYQYNGRYAPERENRIRIYVRKASCLDSWKAAAAPYADVFESDFKGKDKAADYPGYRTLGVILVATDKDYPAYAWVIDGTPRGFKIVVR